MPERFDLNEWFLILSVLLSSVVLFIQSRRWKLPVSVITVTSLLNIWLAMFFDFSFAGPPLDTYDFMDSPKWEFVYGLTQITLYPINALIFIKGYLWWKTKPYPLFPYIAGWVLFSIGYEWLSLQADVLAYGNWKMWYSVFVYLGVFLINIAVYEYAQKQLLKKPPTSLV